MSTQTLPDVEAAVIAYLLETDVATEVEDRIYAEIPEGVLYPFITVQKFSETDTRHWIATASLQIGGWASRANPEPRALARDLCEATVAALHDAVGFMDGSIILGAGFTLVGPRAVYDRPTSNPRFLADVALPYHPASGAS